MVSISRQSGGAPPPLNRLTPSGIGQKTPKNVSRAVARAAPRSDAAGAPPGQGRVCLATRAAVRGTRPGCHASGWHPRRSAAQASYHRSACLRAHVKFAGVVVIRPMMPHISPPRVASQAHRNCPSVRSEASSDPVQDAGLREITAHIRDHAKKSIRIESRRIYVYLQI